MYFQAKSFEHYSAGYEALPEVLKEQLENVIFAQTGKAAANVLFYGPIKGTVLEETHQDPTGRLTPAQMETLKRNLFIAACFMGDVKSQWDINDDVLSHDQAVNGAKAVVVALYPDSEDLGIPGEEQEFFHRALEDWREVFFELPPFFVWHFFGVYREHFQDWENAQQAGKGEP